MIYSLRFVNSSKFLDVNSIVRIALEIDENSIIVEKDIVDMIPLNFNINNKNQFPDLLKMIKYKQAAK